MQNGLPLSWPAFEIAFFAVLANLSDMPLYRLPSFDLPLVITAASAHIVSAVPLEPSSGVILVYPALLYPVGQRLRGIYTEKVQLGIVELVAEFYLLEPFFRKLFFAVRHILAAEDTQLQHLLWGKFRLKLSIEVSACRLRQIVNVTFLHQVIDNYPFLSHFPPNIIIYDTICKQLSLPEIKCQHSVAFDLGLLPSFGAGALSKGGTSECENYNC
jgi:hypothetical protein